MKLGFPTHSRRSGTLGRVSSGVGIKGSSGGNSLLYRLRRFFDGLRQGPFPRVKQTFSHCPSSSSTLTTLTYKCVSFFLFLRPRSKGLETKNLRNEKRFQQVPVDKEGLFSSGNFFVVRNLVFLNMGFYKEYCLRTEKGRFMDGERTVNFTKFNVVELFRRITRGE